MRSHRSDRSRHSTPRSNANDIHQQLQCLANSISTRLNNESQLSPSEILHDLESFGNYISPVAPLHEHRLDWSTLMRNLLHDINPYLIKDVEESVETKAHERKSVNFYRPVRNEPVRHEPIRHEPVRNEPQRHRPLQDQDLRNQLSNNNNQYLLAYYTNELKNQLSDQVNNESSQNSRNFISQNVSTAPNPKTTIFPTRETLTTALSLAANRFPEMLGHILAVLRDYPQSNILEFFGHLLWKAKDLVIPNLMKYYDEILSQDPRLRFLLFVLAEILPMCIGIAEDILGENPQIDFLSYLDKFTAAAERILPDILQFMECHQNSSNQPEISDSLYTIAQYLDTLPAKYPCPSWLQVAISVFASQMKQLRTMQQNNNDECKEALMSHLNNSSLVSTVSPSTENPVTIENLRPRHLSSSPEPRPLSSPEPHNSVATSPEYQVTIENCDENELD